MKTKEQIEDELAVLKRNYENLEHKDVWVKLYKKLSSEDRNLLQLAQAPTLLFQEISALEWVLKSENPLVNAEYLKGEEIPYPIAIKLALYSGRNVHDVNANTYKLREAYKKKDTNEIEKILKILRTMVNGI